MGETASSSLLQTASKAASDAAEGDGKDAKEEEFARQLRLEALTNLMGDLIKEPAFDQLRSKEQLGYIVHADKKKVSVYAPILVALIILNIISLLNLEFMAMYHRTNIIVYRKLIVPILYTDRQLHWSARHRSVQPQSTRISRCSRGDVFQLVLQR